MGQSQIVINADLSVVVGYDGPDDFGYLLLTEASAIDWIC